MMDREMHFRKTQVVQHVMEHSSRPGDRQHVMNIIRKNILSLSCPAAELG